MPKAELAANIFVRLVMAGRANRGLRLTAEECRTLAEDDPIVTAALVAAEEAGFDISEDGKLIPNSAS